jgi:hypothetical protein
VTEKEVQMFLPVDSKRVRLTTLLAEIECQSSGIWCIWVNKMRMSVATLLRDGKLESYLEGTQSLESAIHLVWHEMVLKDLYDQQLDPLLVEAIVIVLSFPQAESTCVGTVRVGRAR